MIAREPTADLALPMTFDVRNVPGIIGVLVCFGFAIWLWRIGTRGSTARQLSVLLVIEGITLGTSGSLNFGMSPPQQNPDGTWPLGRVLWSVLHHVGDVAIIALYPPFLANVLRTRWTMPFANATGRVGIAVFAVVLFGFIFSFFGLFGTPSSHGAENYLHRRPVLYLVMCLTFVYALAVSLQALRTATSDVELRRARAFVVGFGIRDVCWAVTYGGLSYLSLNRLYAPDWLLLIYPVGSIVEVPLIAYGILTTQLFDIDLRVKRTIRRSTLAAMVVAIVYFVSEAADRLLSSQLGAWPGLIAAALVVYFLTPLQRIAERVANRAMPEAVSTPEYLAYRKMQVYEAALTEALGGDGISDKERAILTRLRESLAISADDARAMEDDLRARRAVRATDGSLTAAS
jgi:hypothetical protein